MNQTPEYRLITSGILAICALGAVSAVVPVVQRAVNTAAVFGIAVAAGWLAVTAVRRELRIRRRLAALARPSSHSTGAYTAPGPADAGSARPGESVAPRPGLSTPSRRSETGDLA